MSIHALFMPKSQVSLNLAKMCYEFRALEDKNSSLARSKASVHKQAKAWGLSTAPSSSHSTSSLSSVLYPSLGSSSGRPHSLSNLEPLPPSPTRQLTVHLGSSSLNMVLEHQVSLSLFHNICKVKTIFIMTLRCFFPFSLSRHSHWWYKSNSGWRKPLLP